jgi:tetratricopeptide (TPR) repeat protein
VSDPIVIASIKAEDEMRLVDAEKILLDAVHKTEASESDNPQLSLYFKRLAGLHERKQQYTEALDWLHRARDLDEKAFGPTDKSVVGDMAAIASILLDQGSFAEAEHLLKEALDITNPDLEGSVERSEVLSNLASVYLSEDRMSEALSAGEQALKTCESGPSLPLGACGGYRGRLVSLYRMSGRQMEADQMSINTYLPAELAGLNSQARRYAGEGVLVQAEISYREAISWIERNPSAPAENVLPTEFVMLGEVLERQGRDNEAEELYKNALQLQETRAQFPECCETYELLNLYQKQGRLHEIPPILQQVLEIQQRNLGADSESVADTLLTLAGLYSQQGLWIQGIWISARAIDEERTPQDLERDGEKDQSQYVEAAALYKRALEIQKKNMGSDHPELVNTLSSYARVLRMLHDDSLAAQVQTQIDAIQKKMADEKARH